MFVVVLVALISFVFAFGLCAVSIIGHLAIAVSH